MRLRLVARHLLERAREHDGLARTPASSAVHALERHRLHGLHQPRRPLRGCAARRRTRRSLRRASRRCRRSRRDRRARRSLSDRTATSASQRGEVAREQPRGRLADVADAEREDEPVERDLAARSIAAIRLSISLPSSLALLFLRPRRILPGRFARVSLCSRRRSLSALSPRPRARVTERCPTDPVSSPFSCSVSMLVPPSPSMSNAWRDTKCLSRSTACAGQISPPVQRRAASLAGLLVHLAHGVAAARRAGFRKLVGLRAARPAAP